MIEKKHFENIIIIQSLETLIHKHQRLIEGHLDRQKKIERLREEKSDEKEQKKEQLSQSQTAGAELEGEIDRLVCRLHRLESNASAVTSQIQSDAINKEMTQFVAKKETLELSLFENLEHQESLENEIDEISSFLKGSIDSLAQIKLEVEKDVKKEESEISNLNNRIENLFSLCPSELVSAYQECSQNFSLTPLAFIEKGNCNRCFFAIERNLQSQVERGLSLEYCPGCGRILAPTICH